MVESVPLHSRGTLAIITAFMMIAIGADASWTVIGTVPPLPNGRARPLSCGFFFDARHGLVGTGNGYVSLAYTSPPPAIFYCNDGVTWIESTHPVGNAGAEVTSIVMVDSLRGYASLLTTHPGDTYGVWSTTDGGVTWAADSAIRETASQVFLQPDGRRHLVQFQNGQAGSLDGLSVAWLNSNVAVLTTSGTNGFPRGTQTTTNGGADWEPVVPGIQAFGIYASPRNGSFILGPEESNEFVDVGPVISNDYGRSWHQSGVWPRDQYGYWKPTGHVCGGRTALYVQSTVELQDGYAYPQPRGLCRSTDNGLTWVNIGGPSNSLDTRFTTAGCRGAMVIAFDPYGNIWSSDDGGDGTMREDSARPWLSAPMIALTASLCGEIRGGVRVWNDHCDNMRIDSIIILDSNLTASGALSLDTIPKLPHTFVTDASDTIGVRWRPRLVFRSDTSVWATVRVRYYSFTSRSSHDTVLHIRLIVKGEPAKYQMSADSIAAPPLSVCAGFDTTITITNLGCDSLWIPGARASGTWSVTSAFPIAIPPSGTGTVKIHHRGISVGSFSDSVALAMLFQGRRDSATVALFMERTHGSSNAVWNTRVIDFGTRSLCGAPDSAVVTVRDAGCDTLAIVGVGAWSNAALSWVGLIGLISQISPVNPLIIAPGDFQMLGIAFTPASAGPVSGTATVTLLHADGTQEAVTVAARGIIGDSGRFVAAMSTHALDFGSHTACAAPDTQWITVRNAGCDTLFIDGYDAWSTGSYRWVQPATGVLPPGAAARAGVECWDHTYGVHADAAAITVRYASGSIEHDSLAAVVDVTDSGRFALSTDRAGVTFGDLPPCGRRDSSFQFSAVPTFEGAIAVSG